MNKNLLTWVLIFNDALVNSFIFLKKTVTIMDITRARIRHITHY